MLQALTWAAGGTGFTALLTAAGAAVVFLFRKKNSLTLHRVMLGFAAGVMIAASMWSLLIPAIEKAEELGMAGWLPAAGGSILGIVFLLLMDFLLPHFGPESFHRGASPSRTALLVLAVTLHNIPEGRAGTPPCSPPPPLWPLESASRTSPRARPSPCPCIRRG